MKYRFTDEQSKEKAVKLMEAEIRERDNHCGKLKVAKIMREVSKEALGRSWDLDTCKFAYDIVIEALIRACLTNGGVVMPGFMTIKITRRKPSKSYNVRQGMITDKPGFNACTAKTLPQFKEKVKALQTWFVEPGTVEEFKKELGLEGEI